MTLFGMEERGESGKQFRKPSSANFFPYRIGDLCDHPGVEHGKWDGGENVSGIVISCVDTTQSGEGHEIPRPTESGSPY
jgi:hypothetical protein